MERGRSFKCKSAKGQLLYGAGGGGGGGSSPGEVMIMQIVRSDATGILVLSQSSSSVNTNSAFLCLAEAFSSDSFLGQRSFGAYPPRCPNQC
ncbi:unnamed protein product [Lota lota]